MSRGSKLDRANWAQIQHGTGAPDGSTPGNIYVRDDTGVTYTKPRGGAWGQMELGDLWTRTGTELSPSNLGDTLKVELATDTGNALVLNSAGTSSVDGDDCGILFGFSDLANASRIYTESGSGFQNCLVLETNDPYITTWSKLKIFRHASGIETTISSATFDLGHKGVLGGYLRFLDEVGGFSADAELWYSTSTNLLTLVNNQGDILINTDDVTKDVYFNARGSGNIPFNESGDETLDGAFTAVSLLGALNELKGAIVGEQLWDRDAYNAVLYPENAGDIVYIDMGAATTGDALVLENDITTGAGNGDLGISFIATGDVTAGRIYVEGSDETGLSMFLDGYGATNIEIGQSWARVNHTASAAEFQIDGSAVTASTLRFTEAGSSLGYLQMVHSTGLLTMSSTFGMEFKGATSPWSKLIVSGTSMGMEQVLVGPPISFDLAYGSGTPAAFVALRFGSVVGVPVEDGALVYRPGTNQLHMFTNGGGDIRVSSGNDVLLETIAGNITFNDQYQTSAIPFSASGEDGLNTYAQNIVGAINELAGLVASESLWDRDAYYGILSPENAGDVLSIDMGPATSGDALTIESDWAAGQNGQDVGIQFNGTGGLDGARIHMGGDSTYGYALGIDVTGTPIVKAYSGGWLSQVRIEVVNSAPTMLLSTSSTQGLASWQYDTAGPGTCKFGSQGDMSFQDQHLSAAILLSQPGETSLDTSYQSIVGAINELHSELPVRVAGEITGTGGTFDTFAADTQSGSVTWDYVLWSDDVAMRAGIIRAVWDHSTNTEQFYEDSTEDIGDTSDVTIAVAHDGTNLDLNVTRTSSPVTWAMTVMRRTIFIDAPAPPPEP